MLKYISAELWEPTEGFIVTKTAEEIIKETQRNLSVLAGPGSGKTELLAQRANFLLQTGACKAPQKILALSFKVDAAANIKNRVDLRCGRELARRFDSSTFDAFFISIARRFSSLLPAWIEMPADFDVYPFDRNWWDDYERLELGGQPCKYRSTFTNPDLHSPLDLSEEPDGAIVKIWAYCVSNKIADYPMCRSMAFTIIKNHRQVRNLILSTYKYLFLDEFQDTTDPQYDFVKAIFNGRDTIITAVGDTNQMIMGWAGANHKNFEKMKAEFGTEIIPLAINHRSNSKIVNLINHVIKDLTPVGEEPLVYEGTKKSNPPTICLGAKNFDSIENEATHISKHINSILEQEPAITPSDFALILRQHAQDYFSKVNEIFEKNGLALRNEDALVVQNGLKIQDLMSEPLSVLFILLFRKKIGFIDYQQEKALERIVSNLTGYDLDDDRDHKKLMKYIENLMHCIDLSHNTEKSITQILKEIGTSNIKSAFPEYISKHLNKVTKSFCVFFQDAINKNPNSIQRAIELYEGKSQVKLMTIHKSKGLEFDTVFFVDFHDDSWWALRRAVQQSNAQSQLEEKNSFFVGLSRAKERLFFTKSQGKWPPIIVNLLSDSKLLCNLPEL